LRDYSREYQQKLVSAEFAASLVKSHDWIDYGNLTGQTVAFDQALAKRVNELTDIKIWTILPQYIPQVMEADPEGQTFTWHSWTFQVGSPGSSAAARRLLCAHSLFRTAPLCS